MKMLFVLIFAVLPIAVMSEDNKVVRVNRTDIFKILVGRDGRDCRDGSKGDVGPRGNKGPKGSKGDQGRPGKSCSCQGKIDKDILIHVLNDYDVVENAYYNNLYRVTSKVLTDGRADTGGWGSKSSSAGNWLQVKYVRPVYVKTVSLAGGFIPSWNHDTRTGYGNFYLQYSNDGLSWTTILTLPKTVGTNIVTYPLHKPITAQHWRLVSVSKWVATTEFALKPLIKE